MDDILLAWPDKLPPISLDRHLCCGAEELAIGVRLGLPPRKLEALLLAQLAASEECDFEVLVVLAWFHFSRCDRLAFIRVLSKLRSHVPSMRETRVLTLVGWLWFDDFESLQACPSSIWKDEDHVLSLRLCRIAYELKLGNLHHARQRLDELPKPLALEALMLRARLFAKDHRQADALALLLPCLRRAPMHLRLYRQLLDYLIEGRDSQNVLPVAREALAHFGEHPEILYHMTTLNLYQRHPGLARRSALLQQVSSSVRSTLINLGNQLNAYEMNGSAAWMNHLLSSVGSISLRSDAQLHSNLCMQLASIESSKYQEHVESLVSGLMKMPEYASLSGVSPGLPVVLSGIGSSLRVAWISADITYHPVARFLYGMFAAPAKFRHRHVLVDVMNHGGESLCEPFKAIPGIDYLDVSRKSDRERIKCIREQGFDLAIDLSGWTGGNYVAGFLARLAPVQVNYLGYFASSGLPTMQYWLGDSALFPPDHREWSTEALWRLQRPFLAWQPLDPLPEASVPISEAPSGPIRFGSFNHNRKLSDATLRLWGELLHAVPGARLVLKASADSDGDTQRLLQRRMRRQGLDPERVDWLALTGGPVEHMHQYRHIDIALDPIPNGGCTTTCEALWLGVPTITMAGSHYVSRMSTAVLAGAGLPEWIANDRAGYIGLAREHAARVKELRQSREQWRQRLRASPLGDAADLMWHLEEAFTAMHAEVLNKA